jgi:hydroxypyruvate isomerase
MPRFAANLSMMFQEHPFLDRFQAAADAGFEAVEYLFPYDHAPHQVATRLNRAGLTQALFNLPPGDWAAGMRGMAALPGLESSFLESIEKALIYARALKCRKLHVMAGITAGMDRRACEATYVANLRQAADRLGEAGITVLIEPINSRAMPGYFLSTTSQAADLLARIGRPNAKLQFDVFHTQIMEGDVTMRLRRLASLIGHLQIAGVPDRHEPDTGELAYDRLFPVIDDIGYDGYVGLEYRPAGDTLAGLGWLAGLIAPPRAAAAE